MDQPSKKKNKEQQRSVNEKKMMRCRRKKSLDVVCQRKEDCTEDCGMKRLPPTG